MNETTATATDAAGFGYGLEPTEPAALCDGGSTRCEGLVTDPAHVAAARAGDLSTMPYCRPCRVAAHADSVADEPVQGPSPAPEYRRGFYRPRGSIGRSLVAPGTLVAVIGVKYPAPLTEFTIMLPSGRTEVVRDWELYQAGAERVENP